MSQPNNLTIRIPSPLRPYTGSKSSVGLSGSTIKEAIGSLAEKYPSIAPHIFDGEGQIRSFVNLYLNGEDVRTLNGIDTLVNNGDRLAIVPAIAGGRSALDAMPDRSRARP